ncbi:MAG: hypothetical protein HWD84_10425 [Flavobacteriaceae bacterium]|nr:hypothetical protein [Flavobacteriaceae bacterium]
MKNKIDIIFKICLQGGGAALGFLSILLLAKSIDAAEFAQYNLILTGAMLINTSSSLGLSQYANIYVPGKNEIEKNKFYTVSFYTVLMVSGLLSFVYLLTYEIPNTSLAFLLLITLSINFFSKSKMTTEGHVNKAIIHQNLIVPISLIFSILWCELIWEVKLSNIITIVMLEVFILNMIVAKEIEKVNLKEIKDIYSNIKISFTMMCTSVMQLSFRFIDILMLPLLGFTLEQIALYIVATKLNILFVFAQNFIITKYTSVFSKLAKEEKYCNLKAIFKKVRLYLIAYSLLLLVPSFIFSEMLVTVFGEEYKEASTILRVLIVGALFNNFAGPAGLLLNINGMHKFNYYNTLFCCVLFVLLTIFLGEIFGLIGVAMANTTAVALRNCVAYWKIKGFLRNTKS